MLVARNVKMVIKPGKEEDFKNLLERDVLPLLKQQAGFKHELALWEGNKAIGISLWDSRESAKKYHDTVYPKVLERLNPVMDGSPVVETYNVALNAPLS